MNNQLGKKTLLLSSTGPTAMEQELDGFSNDILSTSVNKSIKNNIYDYLISGVWHGVRNSMYEIDLQS